MTPNSMTRRLEDEQMTLVSANLSWLVGIEACWGDARDVAGGNGLRGGDELGKASTVHSRHFFTVAVR